MGGCLLYLPPQPFYRATIREAVRYWNDYAKALEKLRRAKHWETAKVLRGQSCPDCGGTGEIFGHADDCDDDQCALNGDEHSCTGKLERCACGVKEDGK